MVNARERLLGTITCSILQLLLIKQLPGIVVVDLGKVIVFKLSINDNFTKSASVERSVSSRSSVFTYLKLFSSSENPQSLYISLELSFAPLVVTTLIFVSLTYGARRLVG